MHPWYWFGWVLRIGLCTFDDALKVVVFVVESLRARVTSAAAGSGECGPRVGDAQEESVGPWPAETNETGDGKTSRERVVADLHELHWVP